MDSLAPILKLRLLVAEDDRSNRTIAQLFLKKLGHSADSACTGKEAVVFAAQTDYHLIFMDCHMPEMDGFEATLAIRRNQGKRRHIPIIAMTADTAEGDPEKCLAAGMDGYISKPISPEKLARAIGQHTAIDVEMLLKLCDQDRGGTQLMHDVIDQYLQDAPTYIASIRQGVLNGDYEMVRRAAHALKGLSSNFNAARLCALSTQLEREAEKGWLMQGPALLTFLQEEFENVRSALQIAERKAA